METGLARRPPVVPQRGFSATFRSHGMWLCHSPRTPWGATFRNSPCRPRCLPYSHGRWPPTQLLDLLEHSLTSLNTTPEDCPCLVLLHTWAQRLFGGAPGLRIQKKAWSRAGQSALFGQGCQICTSLRQFSWRRVFGDGRDEWPTLNPKILIT